MNAADTGRAGDPGGHRFPAYGPLEAAIGYVLFYVIVDRATPTLVAVVGDVVPGVASLVGLGLALLLWFVLAVTTIDQLRRQLAALGLVTADPRSASLWSLAVPTGASFVWHAALLVAAGAVAAWTYERALVTAVEAIRWVAALDAGAFVSVEFAVLVVFFVSFSLASHAVDRLVVGGVRAALGT